MAKLASLESIKAFAIEAVKARSGVSIPASHSGWLNSEYGKFMNLGEYNIPPMACGMLACLFEECLLKIKVGVNVEEGVTQVHIILDYSWKFAQGGSNGNELRFVVPMSL